MHSTPDPAPLAPLPPPSTLIPPPAPPRPLATAPAFGPAPVPVVDERSRNAAIAMFVSCALVLVGLLARSWFTARGNTHVGLFGIEACGGDHCKSASWFDLPRTPSELKMFTVLALVGGFASIALMIHTGVMVLRGSADKVRLPLVNLALGLAMFGVVSFLFRLMAGEMSRGLSISWAGMLAVGGLVGGSAIVTTIVKPLVKRSTAA